ncbi:MAG: hypothetical protein K6E19_03990, partial [Lachnospiraceae bacterium]|nr:hypothetical protein [Lachnospiraceae bacterium]
NNKELIIKGLVESFNLSVSSKIAPGNICAVSALEFIYDKYGFDILTSVLELIIMTWEGEVKSFSANMMKGVARLIFCFGDQIKPEIFKEKLGSVSVKEISKVAKERRAGSLGYAEAMLLFYNKRQKRGLHWSMLYNNKPDTDKVVGATEMSEQVPQDNTKESENLVSSIDMLEIDV